MDVFDRYKDRYDARYRPEEYSLQEYLEICKKDKLAYANAAERLLIAIGEPKLVD
jgi:serine protein kinase